MILKLLTPQQQQTMGQSFSEEHCSWGFSKQEAFNGLRSFLLARYDLGRVKWDNKLGRHYWDHPNEGRFYLRFASKETSDGKVWKCYLHREP